MEEFRDEQRFDNKGRQRNRFGGAGGGLKLNFLQEMEELYWESLENLEDL